MNELISSHLLRLRRIHPFFAGLSMFAKYELTDSVKTCETDSEVVYISPKYLSSLSKDQQTGLLLHVTLHAALLHPLRCGLRDSTVWNIASDIVVNNMIAENDLFEIPKNTAFEPKYQDLSVEMVYERLMTLPKKYPRMLSALQKVSVPNGKQQDDLAANSKLTAAGPAGTPPKKGGKSGASSQHEQRAQICAALAMRYRATNDLRVPRAAKSQSSSRIKAKAELIQNHWREAFRKAEATARLGGGRGLVPGGMSREVEAVLSHKLDWRTQLWRFLVRTPTDFSGYDRRFIHQGLYLDDLQAESLKIYMAIDTSGSVGDVELSEFLGEVQGVKEAYENITIDLYFVDSDIDGPHRVDDLASIPMPMGGGGTDFRPFFEDVDKQTHPGEQALIVYLTDGDGDFPHQEPLQDVLWVVTEGGIEDFPFGDVTRLADQYAY